MRKYFFLVTLLLLVPANFVKASDAVAGLKGKILLQIESGGKAWYVNPENNQRYFLGKPEDALELIQKLGLGIKHKDLVKFLKTSFPQRLSGKFLIDVDNNGEAYYIFPKDLKAYSLPTAFSAFELMKKKGLGIKNSDLEKIKIAPGYDRSVFDNNRDTDGDGVPDKFDFHPTKKSIISNKLYKFKSSGKSFLSREFDQKEFVIKVPIPRDRYLMYAEYKPHKFSNDFSNIRDFISADDQIVFIVAYQLQVFAQEEDMSYEQLSLDFVQQLQYNDDKYTSKDEYPKYPIETLMDGTGDCEDLSFLLASLWLTMTNKDKDVLNYALFLFDNHVAVGFSLSLTDKMGKEELNDFFNKLGTNSIHSYYINGHRYFYAETTNDAYEIGEMPAEVASKKARIFELNGLKNLINK